MLSALRIRELHLAHFLFEQLELLFVDLSQIVLGSTRLGLFENAQAVLGSRTII